jgi:hypothetical protein
MMRRWRLRASLGSGLGAFSIAGVAACWYFHAYGFWWLLSILGVLSAAIEVSADVSAYFNAKRRVAEIERSLRAPQAPETEIAGEQTRGS